jgi:hypothetical protein
MTAGYSDDELNEIAARGKTSGYHALQLGSHRRRLCESVPWRSEVQETHCSYLRAGTVPPLQAAWRYDSCSNTCGAMPLVVPDAGAPCAANGGRV